MRVRVRARARVKGSGEGGGHQLGDELLRRGAQPEVGGAEAADGAAEALGGLLGAHLHRLQPLHAIDHHGLPAAHVLHQRIAERVGGVGAHDEGGQPGVGEAHRDRARRAGLAHATLAAHEDQPLRRRAWLQKRGESRRRRRVDGAHRRDSPAAMLRAAARCEMEGRARADQSQHEASAEHLGASARASAFSPSRARRQGGVRRYVTPSTTHDQKISA